MYNWAILYSSTLIGRGILYSLINIFHTRTTHDSQSCWSDHGMLEGPVSNKGRKLWSHIKAKTGRLEQLASCLLKINTTSLHRPEAILNDVTQCRRKQMASLTFRYESLPDPWSDRSCNRHSHFCQIFCKKQDANYKHIHKRKVQCVRSVNHSAIFSDAQNNFEKKIPSRPKALVFLFSLAP